MKKNTFYNVLNNPLTKVTLAASLLISAGTSVSSPILSEITQQVEAASKKTLASTESSNQTQTQTFTITDMTKLNSVTSNTGNVEVIAVNGDQVTVKMTDGASTGRVQTGGTYVAAESKAVSDTTVSSSNSFDSTKAYNNGGFSGTLSKSGLPTSNVISGSYTPEESMYVTNQTSNVYNSGGFSGALSSYVYSGTVTTLSKQVSKAIFNTTDNFVQTEYTYDGGYSGYLYKDGTSSYQQGESKYLRDWYSEKSPFWVKNYSNGGFVGWWPHEIQYESYESDGFRGTLTRTNNWNVYYHRDERGNVIYTDAIMLYSGTISKDSGYKQMYSGTLYSTNDTRVYRYQGTVIKPAKDTRQYNYTQNYSGTVTKPASDTRTYENTYQYELMFDYETDNIAPNITLTPNTNTPTNQNVDIQVSATDVGGIKQVKWAKGKQAEAYFTSHGTIITNNAFTVTENDTYTVYAEDLSGNKAIQRITIDNIDKTAPVLATITSNIITLTNQDVRVNIVFPADANTKEYRLDGGVWTPYTDAILLNSNRKVEARSKDAVGNVSGIATYLVDNVDKVKPTIQSVSLANDYLHVITSDIGSTVAKTEVKINNGTYQNYKEKQIKLIQNTEVTVRVTDAAGNISEESYTLKSDVYYQDLLAQTTAIQVQLNKGGQSKDDLKSLLETIERIKQEANNLVLPTEQTDIIKKATDLAKQIQVLLDALNEAKLELEDLGDNPSQLELDKAKEIIEALPPGPEKDKLLEELEKKQNQKDLEEAKKLVDGLGENPSQAELERVRDIVKDLVDSDGKTELLDIIKDKQTNLDKLVEEATKAVENLDERSTREEVEHARDLINKLPKGPEKDALLKKLKEKEQAIKDRLALDDLIVKAETAVKHAESYPTKFNIELAEKAVNILPENPEKTALMDRIEKIKDNLQFEEAKKKVEQAERYERDPYLVDAIKSVDAMRESDNKQTLKDRLQTILDKLKEQQEREDENKGNDGQFDPTNPDRSIEDAINTIQDPEANKFFTKWHKANNNASKYFSRAMTANASKVKDEMPANYSAKASYTNLIAELTTRTNSLSAAWTEASKDKATEQLFSKAYTLVDLYESSKSERNYKNALDAIKELPDGVAKTAIETQLTSLKNHEEEDSSEPTLNSKEAIEQAEKAVASYEKYKSSYYQKKAFEAVDSLIDSDEKTAFQLRLDALVKK